MVGSPEGSLSLLSRFLIRHLVARFHRRMRDPPLEPTQNVSQNVSQNVEDATFEIRIELKRAFSKSESFVAWRLATPANAGMAISAKEHGRPARAHSRLTSNLLVSNILL